MPGHVAVRVHIHPSHTKLNERFQPAPRLVHRRAADALERGSNRQGHPWLLANLRRKAVSAGSYVYRTTFDLRGFSPATAQIAGQWSSDNQAVAILLNGVDIGDGANLDAEPFHYWTPFGVSAGFVAGVNTLDFVVDNEGGPTALRVEMSGAASCIVSVPDVLDVNSGFGGAATIFVRPSRLRCTLWK